MKKVLLIARAKTPRTVELADAFAEKIHRLLGNDIMLENCEISELFFELDIKRTAIYHPTKGFDIKEFDMVVMRHIGDYSVEAHAIAAYCEAAGVLYTDTYLNRLLPDNKLSTQFALWFDGVKNWPRTLYGPADEMKRRLPELGEKAVLKDNNGSKGRLNFVVSSTEQIQSIIDEHPDTFLFCRNISPTKEICEC